uniref:Uncharacterized protein n=1 Tax=Romanomermis culicivorax TaxID=13658 RepID=A0A915KEC2_ROMCU
MKKELLALSLIVRGHKPFAGVILQARLVTDGSRRIGAVLRPTPDGSLIVRGHKPFAGVILQARLVTDGLRRIGAVLRPTPDGSRILHCDGDRSSSAVWYGRQNQEASVYRAKFTWALPATDLGPFRFSRRQTLHTRVELAGCPDLPYIIVYAEEIV